MDRITGKPFTLRDENLLDTPATKTLAPAPNDPPRFSGQLLEGISNDVKRIYDRTNDNGSVLTGYAPEPVERDYERWLDRWLIEYIPEPGETGTPRLEVRKVHELELDKRLTERFSSEPELLLALTDSDRMEDVVEQLVVSPEPVPTAAPSQAPEPSSGKGPVKPSMEPRSLTIWETKEQFVKALSTVNYRILIESPWIKRATIEYLSRFRDVLEKGNELVILYGIGIKDEHSGEAVKVVVVPGSPTLTEADVIAHCKLHLTGYKIPRVVEFRSKPLPKSNIGKILRRELRDEAAATPVKTGG